MTKIGVEKLRKDGEKIWKLLEARKPESPTSKSKPRPQRNPQKFYLIPAELVERICRKPNLDNTIRVIFALEKLWYQRFRENPVKLTNETLKEFGVSRYQKYRALKYLQETGCIEVERRVRKSPLVTLNWFPTNR